MTIDICQVVTEIDIDITITLQWAPINSASKYVEDFGPINQGPNEGDHLTWAPFSLASKYVEVLGPIKRDAQLSKGAIKRALSN